MKDLRDLKEFRVECEQVGGALGLRSVRKLLISGELHLQDLSCPSPAWIAKQLSPFQVRPLLILRPA